MRIGSWIAAAAALVACPAAAQDAPHHADARAMYERLISFRTAEGHGQVPAMVDYLVGRFREAGVDPANIHVAPQGETALLLVRIPGREAEARPILFSAHMDVVDARPEDWERDPFTLIEEDGYFFGRGTHDNKTGVAALASTIMRMTAAGHRPERTLVFAFIGDEETGMETTRMAARHPWVADAAFAVNSDAGGGALSPDGRPMIYLVQGAEKTYASFRLTATNPGGHSSRPREDNAIYDLARALLRIEAHDFPPMANALTRQYLGTLAHVVPDETGEALRRFAADPSDAEAAAILKRSPEYVGTTRTTCIATMLEAGHAENALPQRASATVNCRIFPGVEVERVRETLAGLAGPEFTIETLDNPLESPVTEPIPEVMAAIERSIHARHPGVPVTLYMESGGTDGLHYRRAGIPTLASSGIFFKPDELFAHGLNERIPVASFYSGIDHIHDLAMELGGR